VKGRVADAVGEQRAVILDAHGEEAVAEITPLGDL
jgi:hypothetical protein